MAVDVYIRPHDVTIGGTAVKSVESISVNCPPGANVPIKGDGKGRPQGVASEGKYSDFTVSIEFHNEKERLKFLALTGTATLVFKTKSTIGQPATTHTIINCCAWKEGSPFTASKSVSMSSISGSFFSSDGTTNPYTRT